MGLGIWSMHYIGMLAFSLPIPVLYDWPTVLVSLLAAIFASAVALFVVSRRKMGTRVVAVGSIIMGAGIAAMHYIGMAAMRLAAVCRFDPTLVTVSVVLAVVISAVALWLAFRFREGRKGRSWRKIASAVLMGAAIPVMHYTGMAAASFTASKVAPDLSRAVSISALGTAGITVVTMTVLALAVLTSVLDRRFSAQTLQLESSEKRLRLIIDTALDAVVTMDAEGRVTGWSPQAERTFGWSSQELLGLRMSDRIIPPRDREGLERLLRSFLTGGEELVRNQRSEITGLHRDGHEFPIELAISPAEHGGVCTFSSFIRDITERKQAEQRLAAQHAATRILAESATLAEATPGILAALGEGLNWQVAKFWILDKQIQALRCAEVWHAPGFESPEFDEMARELTFAPGVGLPGRVWEQRVPVWLPDVLKDANFPGAAAASKAGLHGGLAFPIQTTKRVIGVMEFLGRDFSKLGAETLQLISNISTQVGQFIERREAEEGLRESEERFRSLSQSSPIGVFQTDVQGRCLYTNSKWQEITGLTLEESLGTGWSRAIHPEDRDSVREGWNRTIMEGKEFSREFRFVTPRGDVRWVYSRAAAIRSKTGGVTGYVGTDEDVTERKRVEDELKTALQMKSDFVAFATHQLRTPLAGIKWLLELAAEGSGVPAEVGSLIQDARESAQRLISMVNDLLDVSKLETGKLVLAPKETSLAELTTTVLKDVSHHLEKQGHQLSVVGAESVPLVHVDPQLFRQVILNLVSNAIKYTPPGGSIGIRMAQENGLVRWAIQDSGIGIPKSGLAKLFQKFYRAENVYKVETEGTGLGLYLVRLIVEKSGGRIWCESEENKGSIFQFTIPLGGGH